MKGYIIIIDWDFNGESGVDTTDVIFTDINKAKKRFEDIVANEKTTTWIKDYDETVIEKTDMFFEATHECKRTTVWIEEKEIE